MSSDWLPSNRYWCHQCSKEIVPRAASSSISCPECNGDFVELIDPLEQDDPQSFVAEAIQPPNSPPIQPQGPVNVFQFLQNMNDMFAQPLNTNVQNPSQVTIFRPNLTLFANVEFIFSNATKSTRSTSWRVPIST